MTSRLHFPIEINALLSFQQSNRSLALAGAGATTTTSLPQGAEIKIPGVGATPVAVSTQLPAAVAQLSQQGTAPFHRWFCFYFFV